MGTEPREVRRCDVFLRERLVAVRPVTRLSTGSCCVFGGDGSIDVDSDALAGGSCPALLAALREGAVAHEWRMGIEPLVARRCDVLRNRELR